MLLDHSLKAICSAQSVYLKLSPVSGAVLRLKPHFPFFTLSSGGNQAGGSHAAHLLDTSGDLSALQERHFCSRGSSSLVLEQSKNFRF